MEWKEYLIETFRFNDRANREVLGVIKGLPDKSESVRFFSHLINSMNRWMARITQNPEAMQMSWWDPVYPLDELESRWEECFNRWIEFVGGKTEEQLLAEVEYTGLHGARWAAALKDIALQLNYHSIHHRAQIQYLIRQQGLEPRFVDYIGTAYRKLG